MGNQIWKLPTADGSSAGDALVTDGNGVLSFSGVVGSNAGTFTVDEATGKLIDLVVEPSDKIDPRLYNQDEEGNIIFPFESVKSVKDFVILSEEHVEHR